MADVLTPEQRHRNMTAIKSANTKPELYLRKLLWNAGCRYRIGPSHIPGHPDVFLGKYNTAVFVHGCFWHRHKGCRFTTTPKTNAEFWQKKFERNMERDAQVYERLRKDGIRCVVVWECTLKKMRKDPAFEAAVLEQILCFLQSDDASLEL